MIRTWIAVTGNRNELYQSMYVVSSYSPLIKYCIDCAVVAITGSGTSTLEHLPDMFVGDLTIAGHIGAGECRSSSRFAIEYPNPGEAKTVTEVQSIPFKKPTGGKCFAKASNNKSTTPTPSGPTFSSTVISSTKSNTNNVEYKNSLSLVLKSVHESTPTKNMSCSLLIHYRSFRMSS